MSFDMTRCPQNEEECKAWFYEGIARYLGAPAEDWEQVMEACGLPPGYGPGVIPNASMPYFAHTQQYSGGPKGRIFLPTSTPDELGYYTRCIQYLDDAKSTYSKARNPKQDFKTVKSSNLVWAWYHVAGNAYAPVTGANGGGEQPPTNTGLTEAQVQAMIDDSIAQALEGRTGVQIGDRIALRTNSGLIAGLVGGGPTSEGQTIEWTGKSEIHSWESFTLERGE
jgi:hypothetical protein